jgi:hypothetical protein
MNVTDVERELIKLDYAPDERPDELARIADAIYAAAGKRGDKHTMARITDIREFLNRYKVRTAPAPVPAVAAAVTASTAPVADVVICSSLEELESAAGRAHDLGTWQAGELARQADAIAVRAENDARRAVVAASMLRQHRDAVIASASGDEPYAALMASAAPSAGHVPTSIVSSGKVTAAPR